MDDAMETVRPLTLTTREFIQRAGISESTFYALKRRGHFRGLEAPVPERWSRVKVEEFLSHGPMVARKTGRR